MDYLVSLEPIWEADFLHCSFGFRPERNVHQALQAMREAVMSGRTWVVDADIEGFHHRMVPSRRRPRVRYLAC